MKKLLIGALMACAGIVPAGARDFNDSLRWDVQVGATFSGGDHTPFWMVNGQQGFSGIKRNNAWLRAGIFHDLDKEKRFSWGAGVDLGVAVNFERVFIPQQIYGEVKYRCLNAMLGQKEMRDDIIDSELSSGGMTWSGNSRPIPQLKIGIFDYADFWGTKGWFAVKGYIAYGMYTDNAWLKEWVSPKDKYTLNTLYCSRAIYFRGGNAKKFPLVGELGLRMDSQFGGTTYFAEDANGVRPALKNPTDLKAWIKGLIPLGGSDDTPGAEQLNVQGNFLGSWTFALGWHSPHGWSVKAYFQNFYEDHSMLFFDYPWKDGLWGVQGKLPRNPFITEAVVEYLYTKHQSGPVYWDHTPDLNHQVSARDDYYNNYLYNGWSNYGYGIGNPLIISPIYNNQHTLEFLHNRVEAWNIGLKGNPSDQVDWKLRASVISSWGSYPRPISKIKRDFSMLAQVNYHPAKLRGWSGSLAIGWDAGSLIGHSFGVGITISKVGLIKF